MQSIYEFHVDKKQLKNTSGQNLLKIVFVINMKFILKIYLFSFYKIISF